MTPVTLTAEYDHLVWFVSADHTERTLAVSGPSRDRMGPFALWSDGHWSACFGGPIGPTLTGLLDALWLASLEHVAPMEEAR